MIVFVIFSFILHVASIGAIFVLYRTQQRLQEQDREAGAVKEELDELLSTYIEEIKQENNELKKWIASNKDVARNDIKERDSLVTENKQSHKEEELVFEPPLPEGNIKIEKSFQSQVLSLAANGYTANEIAKQLQVGQTEVELLLKFHEK